MQLAGMPWAGLTETVPQWASANGNPYSPSFQVELTFLLMEQLGFQTATIVGRSTTLGSVLSSLLQGTPPAVAWR